VDLSLPGATVADALAGVAMMPFGRFADHVATTQASPGHPLRRGGRPARHVSLADFERDLGAPGHPGASRRQDRAAGGRDRHATGATDDFDLAVERTADAFGTGFVNVRAVPSPSRRPGRPRASGAGVERPNHRCHRAGAGHVALTTRPSPLKATRKEQQHDAQSSAHRNNVMNQELINMIAGVAFSVFGWFARILWVAVREMEKDLSKLREELPRIYLPKSEAHEAINDLAHEMRGNFRRLFEMLDRKVDK
jgi:hypothetical protein